MFIKSDNPNLQYLMDLSPRDVFSFANEVYTIGQFFGSQVLCYDMDSFIHYFYDNTLVEVVE